jgi:hypothetical protein
MHAWVGVSGCVRVGVLGRPRQRPGLGGVCAVCPRRGPPCFVRSAIRQRHDSAGGVGCGWWVVVEANPAAVAGHHREQQLEIPTEQATKNAIGAVWRVRLAAGKTCTPSLIISASLMVLPPGPRIVVAFHGRRPVTNNTNLGLR